MKKLILLIVLVAAALSTTGYYRGWFQVASETGTDNKTNITVTVDKNKIHEDEALAKDKVQKAGHKVVDAVGNHGG